MRGSGWLCHHRCHPEREFEGQKTSLRMNAANAKAHNRKSKMPGRDAPYAPMRISVKPQGAERRLAIPSRSRYKINQPPEDPQRVLTNGPQ